MITNLVETVSTATLVSIQVGRPETRGEAGAADPEEREWTSAIHKRPVSGPVWLGRTNLAGDEQADTVNHGGPNMAVCVYSVDNLPLWRERLGLDMSCGAFGENFSVAGLDEWNACIGDVFAVGDGGVQVEVSQPRGPCWKLARKWGRTDLALLVQESLRTGWYVRVLEEGEVTAGAPLRLLERPFPQWTVARVNELKYARRPDDSQVAAMAELAECPALSEHWRRAFRREVAQVAR